MLDDDLGLLRQVVLVQGDEPVGEDGLRGVGVAAVALNQLVPGADLGGPEKVNSSAVSRPRAASKSRGSPCSLSFLAATYPP